MRFLWIPGLVLASLILTLQNRTALIEGTVIDRLTKSGIGSVNLMLTGTGGNQVHNFNTRTDREGRFRFEKVPASAGYWLVVSHGGQHVLTIYPGGLRNGKPLRVSDGQEIRNLVIEMIPTGEISGKIVDTTGKTVRNVNASVRAFQLAYYRGVASLVSVANLLGQPVGSATFSRGEYRISGLPPGPLYIGVKIPNTGNNAEFNRSRNYPDDYALRPQPLTESQGYPEEIYFPGTDEESHAQVVYLKAGETKTGIDIVASQVRTRRIRGTVIDGNSGVPKPAHLMLISSDAQPGDAIYRVLETQNGRFDLRSVLPGSYYLVASTIGQPRLSGRIALQVDTEDRSNLTVPVRAEFDLTGQVYAEGALTNAELSAVTVTLKAQPPALTFLSNSDESVVGGFRDTFKILVAPSVRATANRGEFKFRSVLPWDYTVEISHPFDDAYIKSINLGNRVILESGLTTDVPPAGVLQIVLSAPAGSLEGQVLDPAREPAGMLRVVLIPDQRQRHDLYRDVWTNDQGRYQLRNLHPGSYKLFAWEFVENQSWLNPDFLRLYEAQGIPVRIEEGGHITVNLQTIPAWF